MKVFLSWSGDQSKALAQIFDNWLPGAIQAIKPYFSPDDVEKGARWSNEIATELEACRIGLLFITRENRSAEWVMFEAGSLAKSVGKSRVVPILFGLEPSELTGPLVQFQAAVFSRSEIERVVKMINRELGEQALASEVLASVFEMWWSKLETQVAAEMTNNKPTQDEKRSTRDMVEETLGLVRALSVNAPRYRRIPRVVIDDLVRSWAELAMAAAEQKLPSRMRAAMIELRRPLHFAIREVGAPEQVRRFHVASGPLMSDSPSPGSAVDSDSESGPISIDETLISRIRD